MGMDRSVNLTPYVEVEGELSTNKIKTKIACPAHSDMTHNVGNFCTICGEPLEPINYTETEKIRPYQVLVNGGYEDNLISTEYLDNILLPNDHYPDDINIDEHQAYAIDLSYIEDIRYRQMIWLGNKYKEEIELLKEVFGRDKVVIKWGLVSYWG